MPTPKSAVRMESWSSTAFAASAGRPGAPFPARVRRGTDLLPRGERAGSVLARRPAPWPESLRTPGSAACAEWPRPAADRATAPPRPSPLDDAANGAPQARDGRYRRLGIACLHETGSHGAGYRSLRYCSPRQYASNSLFCQAWPESTRRGLSCLHLAHALVFVHSWWDLRCGTLGGCIHRSHLGCSSPCVFASLRDTQSSSVAARQLPNF